MIKEVLMLNQQRWKQLFSNKSLLYLLAASFNASTICEISSSVRGFPAITVDITAEVGSFRNSSKGFPCFPSTSRKALDKSGPVAPPAAPKLDTAWQLKQLLLLKIS